MLENALMLPCATIVASLGMEFNHCIFLELSLLFFVGLLALNYRCLISLVERLFSKLLGMRGAGGWSMC